MIINADLCENHRNKLATTMREEGRDTLTMYVVTVREKEEGSCR